MSEKSRFVDPPGGRSCDDTGIGDGAVYICIQERDEMDDTKKKFLGLVYLIIGAISLFSGLSSTAEVYRYYENIPVDFLALLILSYALSGITFFFGIRCVK